ncbi:MAG TPA: hypothetical protein VGD59_06610 [Acidisarcina sp.]
MIAFRRAAVAAVVFASFTLSALAADVTGKWTSTFDTAVGEQHYTYTFKVDGEKLTGTAVNDSSSSDITDGKIKGDDITFVENLKYEGQTLVVTYVGKVSGDEIKFTRTVGDYGSEELVAKRAK